jgi:hypothetical protein
MMPDSDDPFISDSLTYGFLPTLGSPMGSFAAVGLPLSQTTKLSFGVGKAQTQLLADVSMPNRSSSQTFSIRLDQQAPGWRFSVDAGSSLDTGGFFGSVSSGALKMADQTTTAWATATAQAKLSATWTVKGTATLAAVAATHPEASLITEIGPVLASSFALGLSGRNLLREGDLLLFEIAQPIRAERGMASLATGIGRDWSTGGVIMGQWQAALTPSGREIDFETGYGISLGHWRAQANAGFALDTDHTRGKNAVLSLFTLSRQL